ncbi:heavy metal translocating P-type ATPase [Kineobactrum salinum]|uniref:heavy metal translocating P-type ATPase n=1 Tax=Kineobactrum salinum TaxID=2708301 RepID=UPI0018D9C8E6|nr:heavy metal translocating P-type ATPase [Kineobactrum salinum]
MTATQACFHCGEPLPPGTTLTAMIDNIPQPVCCPGCQAVARLIASSGMTAFYRQRTAFNQRPEPPAGETGEHYQLYNDPALKTLYCTAVDEHRERARLLLGGISCAACTWLIEQSLLGQPGIIDAQVNLQQQRLDVLYDPTVLQPASLFARVEALGYSAQPYQHDDRRELLEREYRSELRRLGVAGLGMMQVGMFAVALHAGEIQGIAREYESLLRMVSLLVASFVVGFSARPFFTTAWRHLRHGALVMDLPVAMAIGLAWSASVWATLTGTGQVYFDSVVMFSFFLLLGRFLEKRVRRRHDLAGHEAEQALPMAVTAWRDQRWQRLPRRLLAVGDRLRVKAGETIAVDGQIESGCSAVREDSFNGEHLPRTVGPGDPVFAGTINLESAVELSADTLYHGSRLAALQRSVELATRRKPRIARLADRVASWFVAAILLITSGTALVWSQLAPEQAFWISLSVLVISCPCALALATPAALTAAASGLRRSGVIVHGDNALESLARATILVFDKTGTLTEGKLQQQDLVYCDTLDTAALQALAAGLQQYSNHPVAHAFDGVVPVDGVSDVTTVVGAGVEAHWQGHRYRMGSTSFCRELAPGLGAPPATALYWVALCSENRPLAWFGLRDTLRPEAKSLVAQARNAGLQLALLTGDSSAAGPALAVELGISEVATGLSPEQKMEQVRSWQQRGEIVAAVGDGLNDAPLLGLADASFAVANATDLARAQADFVIDRQDLHAVARSLRRARHCRRVIIQNLGWALIYNGSAIPLAALGHVPRGLRHWACR